MKRTSIDFNVKYTVYILRDGVKIYLDSSLQNTTDKSKAIKMTITEAIIWCLKYGSTGIEGV